MENNIPELFEIFSGQKVKAFIYDCYDGDTCKAVVTIPGTNLKVRVTCRMDGYDTPEIRTRDLNEKRMGLWARDQLREKILEKDVLLICRGTDKYGRLLTVIELDDEDVNQYMLDNNLGHPYGGGTKSKVTYNDDYSFIRMGATYVVKSS
jgi:micrococcal nuclease